MNAVDIRRCTAFRIPKKKKINKPTSTRTKKWTAKIIISMFRLCRYWNSEKDTVESCCFFFSNACPGGRDNSTTGIPLRNVMNNITRGKKKKPARSSLRGSHDLCFLFLLCFLCIFFFFSILSPSKNNGRIYYGGVRSRCACGGREQRRTRMQICKPCRFSLFLSLCAPAGEFAWSAKPAAAHAINTAAAAVFISIRSFLL